MDSAESAHENVPSTPAGVDDPDDTLQVDLQPQATPPAPKPGCGVASAASPSTCCPTGWTQLTGDALVNTYQLNSWDVTAYCVFGYDSGDVVRLGSGNDLVYAGDSTDSVHGGPGDDNLRGEAGNDTLIGGPGGDLLNGGSNDDTIHGNAGADEIYGGIGNDTIRPGPGLDLAAGEDGNDIFVIGSPCEVSAGDVVSGGLGTDKVRSPLSRTQLTALGVTFSSIETFEVIAYDHSECLVVGTAIGAAGPVKPSGSLFTRMVPRDDGTVLAGHQFSVFSVGTTGTISTQQTGDAVMLAPTAHAFGVRDAEHDEFRIYDGAGSLEGAVSPVPAGTVFGMFPTSDHVAMLEVDEYDHDNVTFDGVRVLNLDGTQRSQYSAPDLQILRLTPTHVIHTNGTNLVKTDLDGVQAWSVARDIFNMDVSLGATSKFIAIYNGQGDRVYHFSENGAATATLVDGVTWDARISPNGVYSAVTVYRAAPATPRLYLFKDAALRYALAMPLVYANSLSVSDLGEVFVGGQDDDEDATVLVYHHDGNLLWQQGLSFERNGYRPMVVTAPAGNFFIAGQTSGLNAFAINRSPT